MNTSQHANRERNEPTGSLPLDHCSVRSSFEKWITAPPFEKDVSRYGLDQERYAWPGHYRSYYTELAWCAWCAAQGIEISPNGRDEARRTEHQ